LRFGLLARFRHTFESGPYRHRDSQLGNRIGDFLFEDLYTLSRGRFRQDVDSGLSVLNPMGISPGVRARRGDGSFGRLLPGRSPRPRPGFRVPIGPTAAVEIGVEVKILAKAMSKQIDRVNNDLCAQAQSFRSKNPHAVSVGIVGVNHADWYVSYEGDRSYKTDEHGPPPALEAPEAVRRLMDRADGCFEEFLVIRFSATNASPFDFRFVDQPRLEDEYGAILLRLLGRYEG
jgi:hypothetical protein